MIRKAVFLSLFAMSALSAQVISSFEGSNAKAGWQAKDNVQLTVTNTGDSVRKSALKATVSFEKVAYAWIRKANFKAGDMDLSKQGGISFWVRAEKPVSLGVALTFVGEDKKEIRFGSGLVVTDKWTEVKIPYAQMKSEKGSQPVTADELKKCVWWTISANKKEEAQSVVWIDDLAFLPK